ncbi:pimeloyl-ACP methyl ester carboxylesterase [Pedobacter sp. UYEF25]
MITNTNFTLKGADDKLILGDITFDDDLKNTPVILFAHGFKGYKDWGAHHLVANYFAKNGYRYLKFNFSHSGVPVDDPKEVTDLTAFGENTFSKELFDLKKVVDFITQTCGTEAEINLIGHSRGGGLSIIAAASDDRISKLITWSAISDFKNLWKAAQEVQWEKDGVMYITNSRTKVQMPLNITFLRDYQENSDRLNIIEAAKRINVPWLIVNGSNDQIVTVESAEKLHLANPKSHLEIVHDADHVYGASQPYLKENLPKDLLQVCEKCLIFLREIDRLA